MPNVQFTVTIQPHGLAVQAAPGSRLIDLLAQHSILLDLPCGGEGVCGKCRVVVTEGNGPLTATEEKALDQQQREAGERLACQVTIDGPMAIDIPETSLITGGHQILTACETAAAALEERPIRRHFLEIAPPSRSEAVADLARIEDPLGPVQCAIDTLRGLPQALRQADGRVTALTAGDRLIDVQPGHSDRGCYAVAVDLGTTTLVVSLIDTCGGGPPEVTARLNPQTAFGDDVVTRIQYARDHSDGLERLHSKLHVAVNGAIVELCGRAGINPRDVYLATFTGNTTMQHLFCKLDPRYLGESPFTPVAHRGITCLAEELGVQVHPKAEVYVMPCIGGFVGGDTVAGILATGMLQEEGVSILADIGTNGEIVLVAGDRLLAAATAAGPAFEGARIRHGMRGTTEAIERVWVEEGHLRYQVIGGRRPRGLCGSALIDVAAELLRYGILVPEGRLLKPAELPAGTSGDLRERLRTVDGEPAFLLAAAAETSHGRAIVLTQRDIRQLQLASGAIRAGIVTLLHHAGIEPHQLKSIFLAGGFGNYIRRRNAQRIGLLPHSLPRERILYRGNTSLMGAELVALSRSAREQAEAIARRAVHIDLSTIADFRWAFAESMIFPGPEVDAAAST